MCVLTYSPNRHTLPQNFSVMILNAHFKLLHFCVFGFGYL